MFKGGYGHSALEGKKRHNNDRIEHLMTSVFVWVDDEAPCPAAVQESARIPERAES